METVFMCFTCKILPLLASYSFTHTSLCKHFPAARVIVSQVVAGCSVL